MSLDQFAIEREFVTVREKLIAIREGLDDYGYDEAITDIRQIETRLRTIENKVRKDFEP